MGSISGIVFNDFNGDGKRQTSEVGLGGWTVFLDTDNDGILDSTEKRVVTDADGNWSFASLPGGAYIVRIIPRTGFKTTVPVSGAISIAVAAGKATTGVLFGEQKIA